MLSKATHALKLRNSEEQDPKAKPPKFKAKSNKLFSQGPPNLKWWLSLRKFRGFLTVNGLPQ